MTPDDLARLKALAERATPGKRVAVVRTGRNPPPPPADMVLIAAVAPGHQIFADHSGGSYPSSDMEFIAACDPTTILALIEAATPVPAGRLTFDMLRTANLRRLPLFKNRRGEPAHSEPDGSDWSLAPWANAVTGELGELANIIKKIERGDFALADVRAEVSKELADVQTYLDLLAFRCGVDLGAATVAKFNEVSERVGCDVRLPAHAGDSHATLLAERDAARAEVERLREALSSITMNTVGTSPRATGARA